jgi:branched-chain amino acid aminotransferase
METTELIWYNGEFIKWEEAKVHVLAHGLHYGSGVFEGIRFYETPKGPAIFRLEEHTERLFYSAKALEMEIPFTPAEINKATVATVAKNGVKSGYIRPLAFYSYGKMGLNPIGAPVDTIIACWPWGKYLGHEALKVKVSKFIRIHPQSTIADAKISGHYVNSIMASLEMKREGYDEALLLDFEGNVAEGPGENFFLVKNGELFTPPLGKVLKGITRQSVMQLATDLGIKCTEKTITLEEAKSADELFFTGTAAEIGGIGQLDETIIGNGEEGEITRRLSEAFFEAALGKNQKYAEWLTVI